VCAGGVMSKRGCTALYVLACLRLCVSAHLSVCVCVCGDADSVAPPHGSTLSAPRDVQTDTRHAGTAERQQRQSAGRSNLDDDMKGDNDDPSRTRPHYVV